MKGAELEPINHEEERTPNGLSANIACPLSGWAANHSASGGLASSVSGVTPCEAD